VSIDNVIRAHIRHKLQVPPTPLQFFLIVPLNAVTHPLIPRSKISPGQSKIVAAEGPGSSSTGFFVNFFPRLALAKIRPSGPSLHGGLKKIHKKVYPAFLREAPHILQFGQWTKLLLLKLKFKKIVHIF
jgi:hypothetical protein